MKEKLIARAAIRISKTPQEVFEAIVDPAKMSNYFISKGSGRMEDHQLEFSGNGSGISGEDREN